MALYALAIGDDAPLSIFADSDEGAEIMMRTCFTDATSADARIRLTDETAGRVVIDASVGDLPMSA